MTNGDQSRVAFILAVAVGAVLVIFAITVLWGVIAGNGALSADSTRFLTIIVGAVVGALAAYIGIKGRTTGT